MSQTNPNGTSLSMSYNADGNRTQEIWYTGGSASNTLNYTYDSDGNIVTASNNAGSYSFGYNADGEETQAVTPSGVTLNYQYDAVGDITQITDSKGDTVTSQYDANGNLLQRNATGPGGATADVSLGYDGDGNITSLGRGTAGSSTYTYDAQGDVTSIVHSNGSGGTLASFSYSYDAAGELKQEVDNGTATNYSYDATGQLTSAGPTNYSYDANGNPNASQDQIGPNNELLSDGTWNYRYDANGNVIGKTGVSNGLSWTYSYDASNELISATETNSSNQTLVQANYTYDVFGNLISSSVSLNGGTAVVTPYVYNDGTLWATLTASNAVQTLYVSGDQADQFFAQIDASNGVGWYLTDHLGSVRDLMNNSGEVTDALTYDAYGNVVSQTNPSQAPVVGWDGYQTFAALGVDQSGKRIYDPEMERWMQQDPILLSAGPNTYQYVNDDPTNLVDPSGEDAAKPGRISEIIANYEQTGIAPPDLLYALMTPSDRAALKAAGTSEQREQVLAQITKAYQPMLDSMNSLLDDIQSKKELAKNPELSKLLLVTPQTEEEKAQFLRIEQGLQKQRERQLAILDHNYEKAADKLVWDRYYKRNLEWAKKYYASEQRNITDTVEAVVPWIPLPGVQSTRAATGKRVPGETPEETARIMTEYQLSGRYHPTLNPLAGKAAEREWMQEGLQRALPVLVLEGGLEFGGMALSKPLGKVASTIAEKTGISKAASKVAGLFRRGAEVPLDEAADFVGPPLSRAGTPKPVEPEIVGPSAPKPVEPEVIGPPAPATPQVAGTLQRDVGLVLNEQIAGGVPQGYAGHHLISIHLAEDSVAMQRAAQLGYNINRGSNGMALPTTLAESQASGLPLHSGRHLSARHAGSADAFVQQRLNALDARVRAGTISDQELLTEIGRIEDATRQALRTNQVRLQANDPHWRTPQ